jgi:predicted CXXCH cytochrome family protein
MIVDRVNRTPGWLLTGAHLRPLKREGGSMRVTLAGAALAVLLSASSAFAQSTVAFGPHDLSAGSGIRNTDGSINGQTCVFCHTPHMGSVSVPLWNRSSATTTYQVYTSSTMDALGPTSAAVQSSVSGACMSCHDGSIAVDVLTNLAGAAHVASIAFTRQATSKATYSNSGTGTGNIMSGGAPFLGTDLRNDHPITIIYETARAATPAEFVTQTITGTKISVGTTNPLPLYGSSTATATVECASCHNPHNNANGMFLRKSNAGSAMCLTCHIK